MLFNNKYKQKREKFTMFSQLNFQSQANFDQDSAEYCHQKIDNLPTTANNSPGSVKSGSSFNMELELSNDCSFELGTQINHASDIWDASVQLVNDSLFTSISLDQGFNSKNLYRNSNVINEDRPNTIDQAIKGNRLMRYHEKVNFIEELQKETQLCGLLVELMVFFNAKVFQQITFVIHTIWNQRYLKYRQAKKQSQKPIIPSFNRFFGFNDEEVQMDGVDMDYDKDSKEIANASQEEVEELARELFNSKKLKYLNFQEIRGEKASNMVLREKFERFVGVVCRGVFLSAEGIYEQQVSIPTFSEEEEEDVDLAVLNMGVKRVRSYSQIAQEDEQDFQVQSGSKRRKLD